MKLYYLLGACPLTIQIALEWMNVPYELQEVERTELRSPEFLALNPVGSVPVLTDGDLVLTQCISILEYLNEKYPGSNLLGNSLLERTETRRWLSFCNADLHRTFSLVFGAQGYSDDPAFQKQLIAKATERVLFLLDVANKQLEGKDWLTGQRSFADAYLYVVLTWLKNKEIDFSDKRNLVALFDRMSADTAVRTAREKQGLPN